MITLEKQFEIEQIFIPHNLSDVYLTNCNPTYLTSEESFKKDNIIVKRKNRESFDLKSIQIDNNKDIYQQINDKLNCEFRRYLNQFSNQKYYSISPLQRVFDHWKRKSIFNIIYDNILQFDWLITSLPLYRLLFPGDYIETRGFQYIKKLEIKGVYINMIVDNEQINKNDIFVGKSNSILMMINPDFTYQDESISKIDYGFFVKDEIRRISIV